MEDKDIGTIIGIYKILSVCFDKVKYFRKEYFIKGRMSAGYAVLMDIEGKKIDFSDMPKGRKSVKLNNCKRILARKSQLITLYS